MSKRKDDVPPGAGDESEPDAAPKEGSEPGKAQQEGEQAPPAGQEAVSISLAQYEELKTLAAERDQFLKRLQRAVADYQNLQKRIGKTGQDASRTAVREVAVKFVPLADGLARAIEVSANISGAAELCEGLQVVAREFYRVLETFNIRPIEAVGKPFDPQYHEALLQEPAPGVAPNTVVRELQKGFVMGTEVIRPARVTVAAGEQK